MGVLPPAEQMRKGNNPGLDIGYCGKISLRRHYIDFCMQFGFPSETGGR